MSDKDKIWYLEQRLKKLENIVFSQNGVLDRLGYGPGNELKFEKNTKLVDPNKPDPNIKTPDPKIVTEDYIPVMTMGMMANGRED